MLSRHLLTSTVFAGSFIVSLCLASKYDLVACTYTNDQGRVYDLSPLIPKNESGYQWTETVYDTTGDLLTNTAFSNPIQKMLQVHVCRNITKAMNSNCSAKGVAPVYMLYRFWYEKHLFLLAIDTVLSNSIILLCEVCLFPLHFHPPCMFASGHMTDLDLNDNNIHTHMHDISTGECHALGNIKTANIQPNPYKDGVFIDYYGGEAESHIVQWSARLYFVCKPDTKLEGPLLEHLKDSYTAHIRFNTKYMC